MGLMVFSGRKGFKNSAHALALLFNFLGGETNKPKINRSCQYRLTKQKVKRGKITFTRRLTSPNPSFVRRGIRRRRPLLLTKEKDGMRLAGYFPSLGLVL